VSHIYEAGVTAALTTATAIATVLTGSSPRAEIREIGVFAATAAAGEVGLGRPAANGTGAGTGTLVQAGDPADAAGVTTLVPGPTGFATLQPTAPTNFMRRIQLPAVIGSGIVWSWGPGELIVAVSSNLVIWQIGATTVTYKVYVKIIE
jgi:hypothetical protein